MTVSGFVLPLFRAMVVCSVAVLGGGVCSRHVTYHASSAAAAGCPVGYRDEASRRCSDRFHNSLEELKFRGRQLSLEQRYNRTCLSVSTVIIIIIIIAMTMFMVLSS